MAWVTLSFPPGFYANGTLNQARGHWFDGSLVRCFSGTVQPWGGWVRHNKPSTVAIAGKARSMIAWTDNGGVDWIAVGASSNLYAVNRVGDVVDITPSGMTAGIADAAVGGGYGFGDYGDGDYGSSVVDDELVQEATVTPLDTFGENLVGLSDADGRLFKWERDTGDDAEFVAEAPTNNRSLVVTETGHIMLLGSSGDRRLVAWCDAQDETNWTPGLPSEAGNFPLQTGGSLMGGKRVRGGTLLLTDQDAWLAIYNGGPNPFSFEQVGNDCGAISKGAMASAGSALCAWMGESGFWMFNGSVQAITCDVLDRVFGDFNKVRASQVTAYHKAEFSEITWHYSSASSGSPDNDRYATWNYREGHWMTGELARTCGCDAGAFPYPLAVDPDGVMWRHEVGFDYDGAEAWIESGPVQFAPQDETPGERVFCATHLIPDESAVGAVEATFYCRFTQNGDETAYGPYPAAEPTDVLFTTRYARLRLTGQGGDWRVGDFKLDISLGGFR